MIFCLNYGVRIEIEVKNGRVPIISIYEFGSILTKPRTGNEKTAEDIKYRKMVDYLLTLIENKDAIWLFSANFLPKDGAINREGRFTKLPVYNPNDLQRKEIIKEVIDTEYARNELILAWLSFFTSGKIPSEIVSILHIYNVYLKDNKDKIKEENANIDLYVLF